MSTTPPPPPFSYGGATAPQPPPDSRSARRNQRLAAAQAARSQSAYLRQQARAARRPSIVGPLLLVALGIGLLLIETGHWQWQFALTWFGRWWPAVLIFAGCILLGEWAWGRQQPGAPAGGLASRPTLGGGTAFLIFMLAVAGIGVTIAENGADWARRTIGDDLDIHNFGNWPQFLGSRAEFTDALEAPLAPNGTLTIDDPHGDITVTGSSQDGHVHVSAGQHIYTWDSDKIADRHREGQPRFSGDREHQTLTAAPQEQDDTDLTIELPHDASLVLHSSRGTISVQELRGSVELTAQNGDVKLTALRGPVHLTTADDDADITAHSLAGGLTVNGRSGDITLNDIAGPLLLQGDFFGTTHLQQIQGTVHFKSSFTDFACNNLPGELDIEGRSDLTAQRVEGPLILTTTNRNITLNGLRGTARVTDRNGSVNLSLAGPLQPVEIANQNGSVGVSFPPGQGFSLSSSTQNGDIHNAFNLEPRKTDETSQVNAEVAGGGPNIHITTTEGDITLNRSAADAAADWADAPERLTVSPDGNAGPAPRRITRTPAH